MNTKEKDLGASLLEGIAGRIRQKTERLAHLRERAIQLKSEVDDLTQEVELDQRALDLLRGELQQRAQLPATPERNNGLGLGLLDPVDQHHEAIDYPAGGYDIDKVNFGLSVLGCFSVKRDIEEAVKKHDPALSKFWASNALSYLFKEGQIARAQVADRGKRYFYGRLEWVVQTINGPRLVDPKYVPRTRSGQPASERSVIFNKPEQKTAASEG